MDPIELQHRFNFHPANTEEKQQAHERIRWMCGELAKELDELLPDGREKSLAITNLEQVMFWGNAAVARDTDG